MRTLGTFTRLSTGDLSITIAIEDRSINIENLQKLEGEKVMLEISKHREKRSLNANAYFWKLCDEIAKKLGSDKDTIYLMMLRDYGVFEQIEIVEQAIENIKPLFRFVEEDYRYTTTRLTADLEEKEITMVALKCYRGSHEYDSKEMAELINGTVAEATSLGINTWPEEEINNLVQRWEGK